MHIMHTRLLMKLIKLFPLLIIKISDGKLILVNFRPTMQIMVLIVKLRKKLIEPNNLLKLKLVPILKKIRRPKSLVPRVAKNSMKCSIRPNPGQRNTKQLMTFPIV